MADGKRETHLDRYAQERLRNLKVAEPLLVGSVINDGLTSYFPTARVPYRKSIEEISTVSSFLMLGSLEINNLSE
ncbi:hypothetical protein BCM02_107195 [Paenibacillus methanolicus]|uniref:Uncharacterized protein n=1 Tax=Paenibacillus methanolicus TaxID=582686 RepID=A0A5S5C1A4_9BACL|nr:hypothetical protein BCM02_107195 [Paenibacillus methanolicus]